MPLKNLCRLGGFRSSDHRMLCSDHQIIRTIASFRWSRWPYTKTYGAKLDALQRKFLTSLMQIKCKPGEPYDAFVQRRHISGGHLARACGRWSQAWASSVISWNAHVHRAHDTNAWSHELLEWQPDAWLTLQRFLFSALHASRTPTISYRGHVHQRWEAGIRLATEVAAD